MNLENRWGKKAATIPWDAIEEKICGTVSGQNGHDADQMIIASNTLDDSGSGGGSGEDSVTIQDRIFDRRQPPKNAVSCHDGYYKKWIGHRQDWGQIHSQLEIYFEERLSGRSL